MYYRWTEGTTLQLEQMEINVTTVPTPLKFLFTAIADEAVRFRHLLQWDPPSFTALFALQFLNRGGLQLYFFLNV